MVNAGLRRQPRDSVVTRVAQIRCQWMCRWFECARADTIMTINAGTALSGHSGMIKGDIQKTHRVMAAIARQSGTDMGRALAGGFCAIVTIRALITGLRMIDSRQQRFPTGVYVTCLTLDSGQWMVGRLGGCGPAVAIHTTAAIDKVVIKRCGVGPIVCILMTGFTCIGGQRMIAAE
jgi:hypothetical protein